MEQNDNVTRDDILRCRIYSRCKVIFLYVLTALAAAVVIACASMVADMAEAGSQAKSLMASVKTLTSCVKAQDKAGVNSAVAQMDEAAQTLDETLSGPVWVIASKMPFIGQDISSVRELISLLKDSSDSVIKPALEVLEEYPLDGLKVGDGFSTTTINAYIDLLKELEPAAAEIVDELDGVSFELLKTNRIAEYTEQIKPLLQTYVDSEEYLNLIGTFLGDGENRIYLLVAQNSAEVRASGGFPGSVGTIRIEDGVLYIGDFASVYDVLTYSTPSDVAPTEQEDTLFGNWMHYPRDACVNPDFPRVAEVWARAYENYNNESIDGVVSLTPVIMQRLLTNIGSIVLSDGTELNGDNAVQVLQHDLYCEYLSTATATSGAGDTVDALFAETAKIAMSALVEDFDVKKLGQYFEIFDAGVDDRTIMMWMRNEEEQAVVEEVGASGALNSDEQNPVAGVYFSCIEPSKLGWYFDMDIEVGDPVVNEDGSRTYDIKVTMTNTVGKSDLNLGAYILGSLGGTISGYVHLFAPAGGTVSDFTTSNNTKIYYDNYNGLELGYSTHILLYSQKPFVITYKVTTAPGVETPLKISATPTLQDYR